MRNELEQGLLSGRLECPNGKCKAQLGRYAWQGMRCSCGVWICPAFSLQKGRVDEITNRVGNTTSYSVTTQKGLGDNQAGQQNETSKEERSAALGIRLPPGMKFENL